MEGGGGGRYGLRFNHFRFFFKLPKIRNGDFFTIDHSQCENLPTVLLCSLIMNIIKTACGQFVKKPTWHPLITLKNLFISSKENFVEIRANDQVIRNWANGFLKVCKLFMSVPQNPWVGPYAAEQAPYHNLKPELSSVNERNTCWEWTNMTKERKKCFGKSPKRAENHKIHN